MVPVSFPLANAPFDSGRSSTASERCAPARTLNGSSGPLRTSHQGIIATSSVMNDLMALRWSAPLSVTAFI